MANAGYSADNCLLENTTRGKYLGYKRGFDRVVPLPKIRETDNIHQQKLKQYVIDYYYIWHSATEYKDNTCYLNRDWNRLGKIIYKMNQYRQKHWYWEPIV